MTNTSEIYRDWCELVMDAYNEHGGDIVFNISTNRGCDHCSIDVIRELIKQNKVLPLYKYLKSRSADMVEKPTCNECTGQPNLVEGINHRDGSTYLYCPVCKPAG